MICPFCKGENLPVAVRCTHCQAVLRAPVENRAPVTPDAGEVSGSSNPPNQPVPASPPVLRTDQGDLTIEDSSKVGRAREGEGPGVSILSKTPSGAIPAPQPPLDNLEPNTLMGNESVSPVSSGSSSSRVTSRSGILGGLEPGMDFATRFRIEKLLGTGGMGKVYKAFDKELSRSVALKTLQPELVSDPTVILRFKQELLLASRISHKNILRIHDLNDFEGTKYITMAFIEGQDLSQILKEEGPLPLDRALKIIRQLCEALDAAHNEGVVHRDFKPHNVLVGKHDQVYVSDFGLATSLESAQMGMTRSGAVVGTPRYMSPEQVEGRRVDSRSDLYSLGIVFYEMVTGQVPFSGDSAWQIMYQRVQQTPIDVKEVKPDLADYVARVIMHCLEKDPAKRYQSAREIITDLDANRSPSLSAASVTSRTVQIKIPVVQYRWWFAVAGGGILLVGLFFAVPKTRHWVFPTPNPGTLTPGTNGLPSVSQTKFVAVLPFRVLGDQSSLGYVADGLVEAISAKLFQLKDVRLASSTAIAKTDPKTPLSQVAKELGVNLIVHGTLQGSGDNLRVSISLDNATENRLVWSQEFAGVKGDLLTIEDQIYARLVDALALKPSNEELAHATSHPTEDVEAYELYLKGRGAMRGQQAVNNIKKALGFYDEALKKDPSFALAYAGIADAALIMYYEKKDSYWAQKALGAAQQAQRLNDNLPEAHFALGNVYTASGKKAEAIAELKRALQLAPNSDDGYRGLGRAYLSLGQKEQALQAYQKAVDINPYYWFNYNSLGQAYSQLGEYDKALIALRRVIELEPGNSFGYLNVGVVYFQQGKYEECLPYFQKSLQIQPDDKTYSNLGTAYFYLKRYNDSVPMFEKAVELSPTAERYTGNLADAYRWSGQREKANVTYDKAIALAYKELAVNPRDSDAMGSLALYYAKKGMPVQALNFVQHARSINKGDVELVYTEAVVEALANHPDNALKVLREAFERGYAVQEAKSDPELDSLRSRPEFGKLLAEFNKTN